MSFQEKRNIVNIFSSILISGIYWWYVFQTHHGENMSTDELLKFWSTSLLILIPVTIVAHIVIHIVFSITNTIATKEKEPVKDERDKLIELKSERISQYIFVLGFVLSMVALAMDKSVNVMFIVIIGSGIVSDVFGKLSQLYFYRKGI